jgi:hypothetical protein
MKERAKERKKIAALAGKPAPKKRSAAKKKPAAKKKGKGKKKK